MKTFRIQRITCEDDEHVCTPDCGPFVDVQAATPQQALEKALPLLHSPDEADEDGLIIGTVKIEEL